MKKTNAKMLSILFAMIIVVATLVMFEIPALAEEINDIELTNTEITTVEEKTEETAKEVVNHKEKKTVEAKKEISEVELAECENEIIVECNETMITESKKEIVDVKNDFAATTDFRLTWVQDIDTFLVNEKRAIIA